jgi:glutathione peroxidase
MLLSGITEIARGIGLMMGLAVSMAIVPASGTLLETISSPKAAGNSIYIYETSQQKVVLIIDSRGTCPALSEYEGIKNLYEDGPAPLLTQAIGEQFNYPGAGEGKILKSHCRMSYDVQILAFEDNQNSSFPPDPIDRSFDSLLKRQQNSSPAPGSPVERLKNL